MTAKRRASKYGLRFVALGYLGMLLLIPVSLIFVKIFQEGFSQAKRLVQILLDRLGSQTSGLGHGNDSLPIEGANPRSPRTGACGGRLGVAYGDEQALPVTLCVVVGARHVCALPLRVADHLVGDAAVSTAAAAIARAVWRRRGLARVGPIGGAGHGRPWVVDAEAVDGVTRIGA